MVHHGMPYDILIKVKVTGPPELQILPFSKSYLFHHLQCELANDYRFFNRKTMSEFVQTGSLTFGLVFMSNDFHYCAALRKCSQVSTVSYGAIFCLIYPHFLLCVISSRIS